MFIQKGKRAGRWLADQLGGAIVVTLGTAALAALVKRFKAMKDFGWAESFVIGFFLMLLAAVMVAHAVAIWRRSKQPPTPSYALSGGAGEAMESAEGAWTAVTAANEDIAALKSQQMELLDHLNRVSAKLEGSERLSEDIRGDVATVATEIETLKERADRTARSFLALRQRERLRQHEDVIAARNKRLAAEPGVPMDWREWERDFNTLRGHLTSWANIGNLYRGNTLDDLFDLPEHLYKESNWDFAGIEFANADVRHDYKTYRLLGRNYGNLSEHVHDAIAAALWASQVGPK